MGKCYSELGNGEMPEHYFFSTSKNNNWYLWASSLLSFIRNYLNQIKNNNWIAISLSKVFKMEFCCLVCWIISLHWKSKQGETKRLKGKCYNSVEFNNEWNNINPNCILTNYVRLRTKSWCFLWPEKWYWSPHLHNWTHFTLAWASFFIKDNLLRLNIISNPPSIIHSPFQVTTKIILDEEN